MSIEIVPVWMINFDDEDTSSEPYITFIKRVVIVLIYKIKDVMKISIYLVRAKEKKL